MDPLLDAFVAAVRGVATAIVCACVLMACLEAEEFETEIESVSARHEATAATAE